MKKLYPLFFTLFAWTWPAIFIKILSTDFDFITQTFYRYLTAAVFLPAFVYLSEKKLFLNAAKHCKVFIIPSIILVVFQLTWVKGIEYTQPTVAALVSKLQIIFIIIFSYFLFKDEKKVIASKTFGLALILSMAGVAGVILGKNHVNVNFGAGAILLVISSILWAAYIISIKYMVKVDEPFVSSAYVYVYSTIILFLLTIFFGDLRRPLGVPGFTNLILFGSGFVGVAVGNMFNYKSIKLIGASVTSTFLLLTPLSVGVFSYLLLGEKLTLVQILFGAVLIAGSFLAITKKLHRHIHPEV